jgi:hypothetical protein
MSEQDYMPVETARERMGVSPGEMLMLLEAGALRYRKDQFDETVTEVCVEDVADAVEHLTRHRQKEKEWRRRLSMDSHGGQEVKEDETRESYSFTFADSDLLLLLFAAVSYFDAERDIYIVSGGRADTTKALKAAGKVYSILERECRAGRAMSEIVEEIYKQQPDRGARAAVFTYLMDKARKSKRKLR